ncbi:MAG TPA: hypothetical protein VJ783_28200 [Pirellulales bacterium]|nr:hypothetical protein [Pirellulales bacterium]
MTELQVIGPIDLSHAAPAGERHDAIAAGDFGSRQKPAMSGRILAGNRRRSDCVLRRVIDRCFRARHEHAAAGRAELAVSIVFGGAGRASFHGSFGPFGLSFLPVGSSPVCFCQTTNEVFGPGPWPAGLRVDGGRKDLLILFALAFRPGFDERDQMGAGDAVSQLQTMGRQLVTRRLPFLARPGSQKLQFVMGELHGVPSSTYWYPCSAPGINFSSATHCSGVMAVSGGL